jgi:hypothetical protein
MKAGGYLDFQIFNNLRHSAYNGQRYTIFLFFSSREINGDRILTSYTF